jgi:hypothetical protein
MAYRAPGTRSHTAWAITWAAEWRRITRPSGSSGRTGTTSQSRWGTNERSTSSPSTFAAIVPGGRAEPTGSPSGSSTADPSGRRRVGMVAPS